MDIHKEIIQLNYQKKYDELVELVDSINEKQVKINYGHKISTKQPGREFHNFCSFSLFILFFPIHQLIETATTLGGDTGDTFISFWDAILIATDNLSEYNDKRFKVQ